MSGQKDLEAEELRRLHAELAAREEEVGCCNGQRRARGADRSERVTGRHKAPPEILDLLKRDLHEFAGERISDDVCLLALRGE